MGIKPRDQKTVTTMWARKTPESHLYMLEAEMTHVLPGFKSQLAYL